MSSKPEELSPEERLLKVIQQGKAAPAAATVPVAENKAEKPAPAVVVPAPVPPAAEKPAPKPATPVAEPGAAKLKLAPVDKTDKTERTESADKVEPAAPVAPAPERGVFLGLRGVNRILFAAVVVGILVVAYDLWADRPAERMSFAGEAALVEKFPQPESLPPLDTLMQKIGDRNLFTLPPKLADNKTDKPDKFTKVEKPTANFKLMGVSLDSKQPEESMAIIREQTSGNTYFLKTGQRLADSDFMLGPIRAESVILKTQRGELELR